MIWTTLPRLICCTSVFLTLTLGGCASLPTQARFESPIPVIDSRLFGKRPADIVTPKNVFALNETQIDEFLKYFNSKKNTHVAAQRRLANFIETLIEDFDYAIDTNTASQTLALRSGDCMSLATMTTALATLVNVGVSYKMINNAPIYDQRGDVIVRSTHVRSILHEPAISETQGQYWTFRPSIHIDFFPSPGDTTGRRITTRQFIAMFYRNLAAKALWNNDYPRSFWLLMEAVALAPYDHENINMLAILHRRSGYMEKAEELYLYGLDNTLSQVSLLRNYRILLRQQNRLEEAQEITDQLAQLDDPNPFNWISLAEDHFHNQQYRAAIYYYLKALKTAPDLHHAHYGLAKTYYLQGKPKKARDAMNKALSEASDDRVRERYQNKLNALTVASAS